MAHTIDEEHYIERHGKHYLLYPGLLQAAHQIGLKSIEEEIIQIPSPDNGDVAICHATVTLEDGRVFQGIGDCSPANVGRSIAPHSLRMASTRSKARALRDATCAGEAILEDEPEVPESQPVSQASEAAQQPKGKLQPVPSQSQPSVESQPEPENEAHRALIHGCAETWKKIPRRRQPRWADVYARMWRSTDEARQALEKLQEILGQEEG